MHVTVIEGTCALILFGHRKMLALFRAVAGATRYSNFIGSGDVVLIWGRYVYHIYQSMMGVRSHGPGLGQTLTATRIL